MDTTVKLRKSLENVYSADGGYIDFDIIDGYIYLLSKGSNDVSSFIYI
ncbi:hypothetical protein [Metaclostridioides mangenotii]